MGLSSLKGKNPKRSLGQNFFNNKNLAEKITQITSESNPELFFEIGPGTGVFTHLLSKKAPVIAIEKDDNLYEILKTYTSQSEITLVNKDVKELNRADIESLIGDKRAVFYGSLPYNQSKQIISKLLSAKLANDHYYIIQKEVAEKYSDRKKLNRINALSGIFATCKVRMIIKPHNFTPKPKVDSALINFKAHSPLIGTSDLIAYQNFLNVVFKNPRKKLRSKLPKLSERSREIDAILEKRSENLSLMELLQLFRLW